MENTEEELVTTPTETGTEGENTTSSEDNITETPGTDSDINSEEDSEDIEVETTSYDEIIDLALVSIEDYHLNRLAVDSPDDFNIVLEGFMVRGLANFENCKKDLSLRDNEKRVFLSKLSEVEKSIIADYTVIAWLDKEINDIRQIVGMMQNNKEAHRYSEANNLNAKRNRRDQLMEQVATKKTTYSLNQANWLNKWALD